MKEFNPELGVICRAKWGGRSFWVKCVLTSEGVLRECTDGSWVKIIQDDFEFRHIKSERDTVIGKALEVSKERNADLIVTKNVELLLAALYDEGMLK